MTKQELLAMPAGSDIEQTVAKEIFGNEFHRTGQCGHTACWRCLHVMPRYSRDMTEAWKVFLAGLQNFGTAGIVADMEDYGRGILTRDKPDGVMRVEIGDIAVIDTPELAICKAVLLAKWENDKPESLS